MHPFYPIHYTPSVMHLQLATELPEFASLHWVDSTHSTNSDLLAQVRNRTQPLARPSLLGAHFQTAGRGRAGRTWHNEPGSQLMFSCAFDVFVDSQHLATLAPLAGVVAVEALRTLLPSSAASALTLKWPNDVLWQQAKLAGILTEVTRPGPLAINKNHHVVVIGIGLNLKAITDLSRTLNRQIANWQQIVHAVPTVSSSAVDLTVRIAKAWYLALNAVTTFGLEHLNLIQRYHAIDALTNQHIAVIHQGETLFSGLSAGVNAQGQLLVRQGDTTQAISVGEISVRPTQKASSTT